MIYHVCAHPGCGARCEGARCERHREDRKARDTFYARARVGDVAYQVRNGRRWRELRDTILLTRRTCCDPCGVGCGAPSESVHHRVPIRERPDLAYEPGNLLAVCNRCHAALEAQWRSANRNRNKR